MLLAAGVLLGIGLIVSMLMAGVLFAIGFIVLTATRPDLALVFVLGASGFVWDVGGGPVNIAVAEVALLLLWLTLVATRQLRGTRNFIWLPIGVYLAVCVASTF